MDTTSNGHLKRPVSATAITALKVTTVRERMTCLPTLVGRDCVLLEQSIYDMLRWLSTDYDGGFCEYYHLSNGGFYMAPERRGLYRIECQGNGFSASVSEDVAGIIACAMAYSHLSFRDNGNHFATAYERLSDFIFQHPEARSIRAALD
ncbi:MAG: antirestriction protein [Pseudomonadota bacterium]|nr:antirestriction protein [Pseudomonadota bacterium]